MLNFLTFLFPTTFLQANIEDEEFNLFLFTLLILGIIFVLLCLLVAIVAVILAAAILFGLIAMGALSASLLVGLNRKSFTSGFKTFVIVFSTLASGAIGAISFWILNKFVMLGNETTAIASGSIIGLLTGLLAGTLISFVIQKFTTYLKSKLPEKYKH
ncbi:MAG: hypothetical protein EOO50_10945 [Flavobacterium sp.]|uniref:hypothetical protein n=1 Tax=Flavobacterium sp. TaxID=239 RepID=UPI00120CCADC|nr:hypothetical protein [Flavobacterium sp.]RZJ66174.1 MAG: hypothetical protein EOO50_10945 [Flavobacterium sp.]